MRWYFSFFLLFSFSSLAQIPNNGDILSYDLHLKVIDNNDSIYVKESVEVNLNQNQSIFRLCLIQSEGNTGMSINPINGIRQDGKSVGYEYKNDTISIRLNEQNKLSTFEFEYSGIPDNGLIIGENRFGNRTFFADNWPNRARYWFACDDHLSEKAKVSFNIEAPAHYQCVATGINTANIEIDAQTTLHKFETQIELPTKVIVFGLADFSVQELPNEYPFSLSAWVYQEDEKLGFAALNSAPSILNFLIQYIDSFPYEKLANVQSTTMFGGMENAGNIFYDEYAFRGEHSMDALIAHEMVHQWFGNSATETDWQHLWLSEGFATYITDLYILHSLGETQFKERLKSERERAVAFTNQYYHPVVDTSFTNLMHLLNAHSYQKGAWVLHMLRSEVGEVNFQLIIRSYYDKFKYGNASTDDFEAIVNSISTKDMTNFFDQWVYSAGHPILKQKLSSCKKKLTIFNYGEKFEFPIELKINYKDGTNEYQTYNVPSSDKIQFKFYKKIESIELDPNVKLFFEEE